MTAHTPPVRALRTRFATLGRTLAWVATMTVGAIGCADAPAEQQPRPDVSEKRANAGSLVAAEKLLTFVGQGQGVRNFVGAILDAAGVTRHEAVEVSEASLDALEALFGDRLERVFEDDVSARLATLGIDLGDYRRYRCVTRGDCRQRTLFDDQVGWALDIEESAAEAYNAIVIRLEHGEAMHLIRSLQVAGSAWLFALDELAMLEEYAGASSRDLAERQADVASRATAIIADLDAAEAVYQAQVEEAFEVTYSWRRRRGRACFAMPDGFSLPSGVSRCIQKRLRRRDVTVLRRLLEPHLQDAIAAYRVETDPIVFGPTETYASLRDHLNRIANP